MFCTHALSARRNEFQLIDEERRKWDCDVRQDVMDEKQYRLTGGWRSFCEVNKINVGDAVTFGVTNFGADAIHLVRG